MLRRSLVVLAAVLLTFTAAACGDSEGSASEFCALENDKSFENAEDPDALKDALQKMKDKAPDEIKDDVALVADAMNDPTAAASGDGAEDLQKASENISKYVEENCK